jgi:HNH endonuclease
VGVTTPCREWQGGTQKGYGAKWHNGKMVRVHRWVVAQIHGWDAIEGRVVMHLCDNPLCYRYDHLAIGTLKDNMQDCVSKGRLSPPPLHCGESQHLARLNEELVKRIRGSSESSETWAQRLGVALSTINRAKTGKTWSHVHQS